MCEGAVGWAKVLPGGSGPSTVATLVACRRAQMQLKKRARAPTPDSDLYKSVMDRWERHELNSTTIPTNMKVSKQQLLKNTFAVMEPE